MESALEKITFSRGDACSLSYAGGTFDRISCISMIEHVPAPHDVRAVSELGRVLRPGGILVFTFPYDESFREAREPFDLPAGHRLYDDPAIEERIVRPSGLQLVKKLYFTNRWFDCEKRLWLRLPLRLQRNLGFLMPLLAAASVAQSAQLCGKTANAALVVLRKG
jgi:SAM-dependent methyltransferase